MRFWGIQLRLCHTRFPHFCQEEFRHLFRMMTLLSWDKEPQGWHIIFGKWCRVRQSWTGGIGKWNLWKFDVDTDWEFRDHLLKTAFAGPLSRIKIRKLGGTASPQAPTEPASMLRESGNGTRNGNTFSNGSWMNMVVHEARLLIAMT